MKHNVLARRYIAVLHLAPHSPDALALANWTAPQYASDEAGDFASVAFRVLLKRCPSTGELTIAQVNDLLDQLHAAPAYAAVPSTRGARDTASADEGLWYPLGRFGKDRVIDRFVTGATALENKWLARIILKGGWSECSALLCRRPRADRGARQRWCWAFRKTRCWTCTIRTPLRCTMCARTCKRCATTSRTPTSASPTRHAAR
jgi:hypothetical protein